MNLKKEIIDKKVKLIIKVSLCFKILCEGGVKRYSLSLNTFRFDLILIFEGTFVYSQFILKQSRHVFVVKSCLTLLLLNRKKTQIHVIGTS